MPPRKPTMPVPIDIIRHKDKRVNNPPEELRDFIAEEERNPASVIYEGSLYARDPSLDPQIMWRGKEELDKQPLIVPAVPIYIQEKIHPLAIIEQVRAEALKGAAQQPILPLFADFNGITFEEQINFYQYEQSWANRMILGDSLMVMTSIAEKERLKGKVQMIYIDPPYGIEFGSNWQVSTRKRNVTDGKAEDLTRQPEQIRAFRDTWKDGIHSYLTYLRDRFVVARELLTESGSIFVQIGDDNVHLVRSLMDEVFGSENYAGTICFFKTSSQSTTGIQSIVDYLLVYAKNIDRHKFRPLLQAKKSGERGAKQYIYLISPDMSTMRPMTEEELSGRVALPENWKVCRPGPTTSQGFQQNRSGPYNLFGETFYPSSGRHWSYDPTPGKEMDKLARIGRVRKAGKGLSTVLMAEDNPTTELDNIWLDTGTGSFTDNQVYVVQTANKVIERCLLMTTDPGDLVLDPTCGSATTAYVAEQWGRRWITIDTSRVAIALARTRLMAARYPYYLLLDSPDGIRKDAESRGQLPPEITTPTTNDIRRGFVYNRVPHITLKSIASNEEIDIILTRWQEQLEPIRAQLNQLTHQSWEEWQIPREPDAGWSEEIKHLHAQWWSLRHKQQREIDSSIARKADPQPLHDQPYSDSKRIRVTGPFTVESISPHRIIAADNDQLPKSETEARKEADAGDFERMIIENLRRAGVQNTKKGERLKFDQLDTYAGLWIHAEGEFTESDGKVRRAAICIGPEHGTVTPELIQDAAKEAVHGIGFDLLIVCGFAFDPYVSEEAKRYGRLTVLPTRMNSDLAMGDELLKKTGAANLFMVFGEPDIAVQPQADGKIIVEINGLDIYDPTTGEIRSSSTDDIACWFIDTDYNEESFFVRHAYFTGADEPYEKLKRALRADIDERAWASLYSTVSRPFDTPSKGKIAIKVINHYGDEVLKVYDITPKQARPDARM